MYFVNGFIIVMNWLNDGGGEELVVYEIVESIVWIFMGVMLGC